MFYEGDLESGIATAIQQSKLVACFVQDGGQESIMWENDYLSDASVRSHLSQRVILLRLEAGSQEAGFLAAIYPLPKTPTLIIIQNGQLKEYLTSGSSREGFLKRVKAALDNGSVTPTTSPSEGTSIPISVEDRDQLVVPDTLAAPVQEQSRVVQELLRERRAQMEAKKKEQDDANKAERVARALEKKRLLEAADPSDPKKAADLKHTLMQKRMRQKVRDERTRVLKRVEDDKAERRVREELRKEKAKVEMESDSSGNSSMSTTAFTRLDQYAADQAAKCTIQVRLFDGTMVKSRFLPQSTLREHVRLWIANEHLARDAPYTFKQILTPQSNRTITISEEEKSLQLAGLTPSATLVLVPVKDYCTAYTGGMRSYLSAAASLGYWLASSSFGLVTGALGRLLNQSSGQLAPQVNPQISIESPTANIRTLRDQQVSEEPQLYNGNALNYEPRWNDEEREQEESTLL